MNKKQSRVAGIRVENKNMKKMYSKMDWINEILHEKKK